MLPALKALKAWQIMRCGICFLTERHGPPQASANHSSPYAVKALHRVFLTSEPCKPFKALAMFHVGVNLPLYAFQRTRKALNILNPKP